MDLKARGRLAIGDEVRRLLDAGLSPADIRGHYAALAERMLADWPGPGAAPEPERATDLYGEAVEAALALALARAAAEEPKTA